MRRLNITLDDETDNLLAKHVNQAETVREAIRMYHSGITTEKLAGMQAAFIELRKRMVELEERFTEQYELVEHLARMLEERMHT